MKPCHASYIGENPCYCRDLKNNGFIMKRDDAITGLEAAIILIVLVITAAVVSYVLISTGFFGAQKSQDMTYTRINQLTSNVMLDGAMYAKADHSGLTGIRVSLKVPLGGNTVDMSQTTFIFSSPYTGAPRLLQQAGAFYGNTGVSFEYPNAPYSYNVYYPSGSDDFCTRQPLGKDPKDICIGLGGYWRENKCFNEPEIPKAPVALFSAVISENDSFTVQFIDESLNKPTSWLWDFGDGTTSTEQHPTHEYDIAGSAIFIAATSSTFATATANTFGYDVTLIVSNSAGNDTERKVGYIIIGPSIPDTPPLIIACTEFIANNRTGEAPFEVKFTDLSTNKPTSWLWNFGDGGTSTEQHPTHTYTSNGVYTVSLAVKGAYGYETETKKDYIVVQSPSPQGITIHAAIISFSSEASINNGRITVTGLGPGYPKIVSDEAAANQYRYVSRQFAPEITSFEVSVNYVRAPQIVGRGFGAVYVLKNANLTDMPKSNRDFSQGALSYFKGNSGRPPSSIAEDGYRHAVSDPLIGSGGQGSGNFIPSNDISLTSLQFTLNPDDELWIVGSVYTE